MTDNRCLAIVDNTDPDNLACVLALANMTYTSNLLGVVVTGRAANFNRNAPIDGVDQADSEFALKLNALRMRKFLDISGNQDVPVFAGRIAPYTIVPHQVHIDEQEFQDLSKEELKELLNLDYKKDDLVLYSLGLSPLHKAHFLVASQDAQVDLIVGGPMTDVMWLMPPSVPIEKIRSVHAQFGMFGFSETGLMEFGDKPRGKRQFNVACDPAAAHDVLMNLDAPVFLYPSDVTRVDRIGFQDPDELESFLEKTPATRELVRIYRIAYEKMIEPRGEKIYLHDLAPVLGYLQWLEENDPDKSIRERSIRKARQRFYARTQGKITHVPHEKHEKNRWGEIDALFGIPTYPERQIAFKVNGDNYLSELYKLLR